MSVHRIRTLHKLNPGNLIVCTPLIMDRMKRVLCEPSPPRTDPRLSTRADGGAEGRLQVAERQRPVHRPVNLSPAPPGQNRPAAHIEVNKGR